MKLHEAIIEILEINGRPMTINQLTEQLNLNKSYQKKDGTFISSFQVHGRTKNYAHLFKRNGKEVSLYTSNKISSKQVATSKKPQDNPTLKPSTEIRSASQNISVFERYLLNEIYFKPAYLIDDLVPIGKRGIYCIKINKSSSMPEPFSKFLDERNHNILYIGIAEMCLNKRLLNQELRAKGHGTFIRSIGAILGYKPIKGCLNDKKNKTNYIFSLFDKRAIVAWINQNLLVNWIEYDGNLARIEEALIDKVRPLINISKNKSASAKLKALRAECVEIANFNF